MLENEFILEKIRKIRLLAQITPTDTGEKYTIIQSINYLQTLWLLVFSKYRLL